MKRLLFATTLLCSAVLFLHQCGIKRKAATSEKFQTQKDPLVLYGKDIYERNSCGNCHTLQIENEKLISLDGVGGKYLSSWLYQYLLEPRSFFVHSEKKPYTQLYTKLLNKEHFSNLASEAAKSASWSVLMDDAEIILQELNEQEIQTSEKTEVLALIAYLQQIPASKRKAELDSIRNAEHMAEEKKWDDLFSDSDNVILKVANDDANIERGKLLFESNCTPCHGIMGAGGIGPNLTDEYWLHGGQKSNIAKTIVYGVPTRGMISWKSMFTPREVGELVSFLASLQGTNPNNAKRPQGERE
ncbi:MAG: c-type cytochrome [Cryomorphaceae bacterium]